MSSSAGLSTAASIGAEAARRLRAEEARLRDEWERSTPVRHFFIDDLLPADQVRDLFERMPGADRLAFKKSLRESKRVGVDLDRYDPLVGAYLLAFQEQEVL